MELVSGAVLLDFFEEDGVARITLNRPERRNAINTALTSGVLEAMKLIEPRDDIGCVMTVASGAAFCSGIDLFEARDRRDHPEKYQDIPQVEGDIYEAIRLFPKPTLAVVEGLCIGVGICLMAWHDLAVAAETAQFSVPGVIRGSYAVGPSTKLPIHIPLKKMLYLFESARYIDGIEADRWGLVSKAVPRDQLYDYSYALAKEVASHSRVALKYGKKVVYGVMESHFQAGVDALELGKDMIPDVDPMGNLEGYLQAQRTRAGTSQPGGG